MAARNHPSSSVLHLDSVEPQEAPEQAPRGHPEGSSNPNRGSDGAGAGHEALRIRPAGVLVQPQYQPQMHVEGAGFTSL